VSSRAAAVLIRTALMFAAIFATFAVLQAPARHAEARVAVSLLHSLGFERIGLVNSTTMYVVPAGKPSFLAVLTPACSSLAAVLAMGGLTLLAPMCAGPRRLVATGAAVAAVVAGNILRIAGSLAVGLVAGRSSLVLFHDSVGNIFSFAYTLGGFLLLLFLLLPAADKAVDPPGEGVRPEPAIREGDRVPASL